MKRVRKLKIKFNEENVQFKQSVVEYAGHEISCEGIRSDKK